MHAEKLIQSFRQGLYWPHVDFYCADVGDWVREQIEARSQKGETGEFLSYVVLDMPGVHHQIARVAKAMKDDAILVIFVPSVTQIGDCVREIERQKVPLVMDKVLELGEGISNGRVWDVRLVTPRKGQGRNRSDKEEDAVEDRLSDPQKSEDGLIAEEEERVEDAEGGSEPVMVCRPKVGKLTIGGGFVGVWRKSESVNVNDAEVGVIMKGGKGRRSQRVRPDKSKASV